MKMHSVFGSTYWCETTFSTIKQVKSNDWNRMDQTQGNSLRLASTATGINKGTIVSVKPRPQASHWQRFVMNCFLLSSVA